MRTGFLYGYGTGLAGQEHWTNASWIEKPWLDNGRLRFERTDRASIHDLYYQAAVLAQIDFISPVLRSIHDPGFDSLTLFRDVVEDFAHDFHKDGHRPPTFAPFIDTGALSWAAGEPFDYANPDHREKVYTDLLRPYLQVIRERPARNPIVWERTPNGRLLVIWWSALVGKNLNQRGHLIDHVRARLIEDGYGESDHVVDDTWMGPDAPTVYGVHGWFNGARSAWSVRTHNGVTTGVAVPGFHDPETADRPHRVLLRRNGDTLREGFAGWRAAGAHYGFLESLTNIEESAGFYRSEKWEPMTLYLDLTRKHCQETRDYVIEPEPPRKPPVPPASVDLQSWPRRGASYAAGLLDPRWDFDTFAQRQGEIFGGRWLTRVNAISASWKESSPHFIWPFTKLANGKFDLRQWDPRYFDRLARQIETANVHGGRPIYTMGDLYSFSKRKDVSADHDQNLDWPRNNVNGIWWSPEDVTLTLLPDDWMTEWIERVVGCVRNAGIADFEPFNEGPEKAMHERIAAIIKRVWPEARVCVNRQDNTPGQYQNHKVGRQPMDMIAFHGWKNMKFLDKSFAPTKAELKKDPKGAAKRPWTFREFFDGKYHNGTKGGFDFKRIICSTDGSRNGKTDPANAYDWPELLEVLKFCAKKRVSIDHQSGTKMQPGSRVELVEWDRLKQIAAL